MKKSKLIALLLVVVMLVTAGLAACNNSKELQVLKDELKVELDSVVQELRSNATYTTENYTALAAALNAARAAIDAAEKTQDVVYAFLDGYEAVRAVPNTPNTYTFNDYTSASPDKWNPHTWETNGDSYIMDYTQIGFVDITYKEEGVYEWFFEMATSIVDVTAEYAANATLRAKWGIPADATSGYAYKIVLNPLAVWEDGTIINADSYIYSMKQLLNPDMKNYRANNYYTGDTAIYNAKDYFNQDLKGTIEYVWGGTLSTLGVTYAQAVEKLGDGTFKGIGIDLNGAFGVGEAGVYYLTTDTTTQLDLIDEPGYPANAGGEYNTPAEWDAFFRAEYAGYVTSYYYAATSERTIPTVTWDDVGLLKTGDYELVYINANPVTEYYFKIAMTSGWLVYEDLYEGGKDDSGALVTTNYGTSVSTYMSYGPYKLVTFEKDKQILMVKNDRWYGYTDGRHVGQYQTTSIKTQVLTDHSTILQMFLKGELDGVSLTATDLATYGYSDYLLKTPETYTMSFFMNGDLAKLTAIDAARGDAGDATKSVKIMSLVEFRQAISLAFDRATFALEVTPGYIPAFSLLNSLYFYDVENNPESVYRNSEQAKQAIVNLYGLEYGEGKEFATLDEAHAAITGYDLTKAKELFTTAYNKAIEQGLITATQKVEINVGAAKGSSTAELQSQEVKFNEFLTAATAGTPLAGKVSVKYIYSITDRYGDVYSGVREMGYGAWGGAAFYPFSTVRVYMDPSYAALHEGGWDPTTETLTITYDFDGDGTVETLTETYQHWSWQINSGYTDKGFSAYDDAPMDVKLAILSALEENFLEHYLRIPIGTSTVVSMFSQKVQYVTTNYNIMYGYGGIRFMTYKHSDVSWSQYVASQNGTLDYE